MWRSLVAHLTGGQGVAGSNPVIPTNFSRWVTLGSHRCCRRGKRRRIVSSGVDRAQCGSAPKATSRGRLWCVWPLQSLDRVTAASVSRHPRAAGRPIGRWCLHSARNVARPDTSTRFPAAGKPKRLVANCSVASSLSFLRNARFEPRHRPHRLIQALPENRVSRCLGPFLPTSSSPSARRRLRQWP